MEHYFVISLLSAIAIAASYVDHHAREEELLAFLRDGEPYYRGKEEIKALPEPFREILCSPDIGAETKMIGNQDLSDVIYNYEDISNEIIEGEPTISIQELLERQSKNIEKFNSDDITPSNGEEIYKALFYTQLLLVPYLKLKDPKKLKMGKMSATQLETFKNNLTMFDDKLRDHQDMMLKLINNDNQNLETQLVRQYIDSIDSINMGKDEPSPIRNLLNAYGLDTLENKINDKQVYQCDDVLALKYHNWHEIANALQNNLIDGDGNVKAVEKRTIGLSKKATDKSMDAQQRVNEVSPDQENRPENSWVNKVKNDLENRVTSYEARLDHPNHDDKREPEQGSLPSRPNSTR
tara:strand:+ start:1369 stop:2421 length:1053 start_codon:yes stop_codon:yes gene_type:complete